MEIFMKGREFHTYTELLEAKYRYEQETKTLLTTKKSAKYGPNDPRYEDLVYSRIQYQCKAGEERKSTSKGSRAVSSSKMNCPVVLTLSVREGKLCVLNSMLVHENHTQDYETFMKYPENSRLKPNEIKFAKELLSKGYDKKTIRSKLSERRGGMPLPQKFWSQIHRERLKESSNMNIKEDLHQQDFDASHMMHDQSNLFTNDSQTSTNIRVKNEFTSNMSHSGDDDDPLSNMFEKCFSDEGDAERNDTKNSKVKADFDNWFKNLIPGEKLSYNEWLWQLEFNFPSLDKLNFIKYGIILGMTIMNKYYCDGFLNIDGNGIKEIDEHRPRKHSRNLMKLSKSHTEDDDDDDDDEEEEYEGDVNRDAADDEVNVNMDEAVQHIVTPLIESSEMSTNSHENVGVELAEPNQITDNSNEHIPSSTQTSEQITCKMCPEVFPTHSQLYNHMCKMHTSHIGLNCPICNKRFQYERNLNQHISSVHVNGDISNYTNNEGKAICEICGASFEKISSLRSHSRYVHSIEKFYCKYCNRKLSSKKSLKEHIQFQHELTFVTHTCEDCQRIFKYKSSYRLHMRKQHGINFG